VESCLQFITIFDTNIVVPPSDIEFGEILCPFEFLDKFLNKREWITIFDCNGIQLSVVLYGSKGTIFFLNEKEGGCKWQF
jgi:hypothetical protein